MTKVIFGGFYRLSLVEIGFVVGNLPTHSFMPSSSLPPEKF